MVKFDQYIAALLEDHDCVIVPDFGGFVANYASAKVNPINHRFDPPYRKISFNKLLVHNDGLFGAYVARKEDERYEDSIKELKNYVLYLKKELRENKKVSIEKVGLLLLQSDGTYRFEQVKNPAFFRDGFGLESFFGKKIERKPERVLAVEPKAQRTESVTETPPSISTPEPVKVQAAEKRPEPKVVKLDPAPEKKVEEPIENERPLQDKKRRMWPIAAAALLGLPIIGYAVWIALNTSLFREPSTFELSDLNPFSTSVPAEYELRAKPFEAVVFSSNESIVIEDNEEYLKLSMDNAPDKTLVVRLVDAKPAMDSNKALHYHIIGGCFSVSSNAEGLVESYRSRGSNASILDKKGDLSRVSIASYATKKEALVALASYQNDISGAWLLYK
ncbi:MAG: SPOR domain-containing protein [Flavobacteriales bacterium]|nr:SPOR domain-containing protein [Flavobacteriales bacterium]